MSDGWVGGRTYSSESYSDKALKETPLPRDVYWAKVSKAEATQTKDGKPAVNITMLVTSKHGGDDGEFSRRVFDGVYFVGKNEDAERLLRRRQKSVADALSIDPPRGDTFEALEDFARDVLRSGMNGVFVVLKVEPGYDGGDERNRVERWLASDEVEDVVKAIRSNGSNGFSRR